MKEPTKPNLTPSGYPEGIVRGSDGTRYRVAKTGEFRRLEPKPSKAEAKRHKRERRAARGRSGKTGK